VHTRDDVARVEVVRPDRERALGVALGGVGRAQLEQTHGALAQHGAEEHARALVTLERDRAIEIRERRVRVTGLQVSRRRE
jgi:hypothetical protein